MRSYLGVNAQVCFWPSSDQAHDVANVRNHDAIAGDILNVSDSVSAWVKTK